MGATSAPSPRRSDAPCHNPMPVSLLPSLLILIIGIGYSPGPANFFSLMCAAKYGRKAALRMWLGLLAGFTVAVVAMAVATHFIGEAMGRYVAYIKYAGAAYILLLAWDIYHQSGKQKANHRDCTFLSGMVVQLTNAKMLLVDIMAFSTFVLPYSDRLGDLLVVAAWLEIAGPGANLTWLLLGGALHHFFSRHQRQADLVMAIGLVVCAAIVVFI